MSIGELRHVDVQDATFAYHEVGAGPLLLLLHGFPDDARTWFGLMEGLAGAGYRAVAPYLRGYLPTRSPGDVPPDPVTLAADVLALISALAPDGRASVVGMDWGGVSLHGALVACGDSIVSAVAINTAHPITLGAVIRDPDQLHRLFHFWFFTTPLAAASARAEGLPLVEYLWRLWSPELASDWHVARAVETLKQPGVLEYALRYYAELFAAVPAGRFPTGPIGTPTLSIFGADDPTSVYSALEEPIFKGPYERVVMDGVGHFPHLERPDDTLALIAGWLRRYGEP